MLYVCARHVMDVVFFLGGGDLIPLINKESIQICRPT